MTAPVDYPVVARNIDPSSDNKIHDDDVAQQLGFKGALVPGVELFAYLTHPLVEAWGERFLAGGAVEVRFRQPVYHGEQVLAAAREGSEGSDVDLELRGPDATVRSVGKARPRAATRPDLSAFVDTPLPATLPVAGAEALPRGPLGSVTEPVDLPAAHRYLQDISEKLPVYPDQGVVHPGALLRMVNALLMRNVALGPWIHTASNCTFLGVARFPTVLRAHGVVTDTFERHGHEYVRYDALVLSDDLPVMYADHTAIYRVADA